MEFLKSLWAIEISALKSKGSFMTALLDILGTQQWYPTAYHLQTEGQTERMDRTLKDTLRHFVAPQNTDWNDHIAMAEFAK